MLREDISGRKKPANASRAGTRPRQGRRLEAALAALRAFDAGSLEVAAGGDAREQRDSLVAEAGEALWYLVVQRDACGLHGSAAVITHYDVPREVVNRLGPTARRL